MVKYWPLGILGFRKLAAEKQVKSLTNTHADELPQPDDLNSLAKDSFSTESAQGMIETIFKRLQLSQPRSFVPVFKALLILEYLLKHGGPDIIKSFFVRGTETLKHLTQFHTLEEKRAPFSIAVTRKATEILEFLKSPLFLHRLSKMSEQAQRDQVQGAAVLSLSLPPSSVSASLGNDVSKSCSSVATTATATSATSVTSANGASTSPSPLLSPSFSKSSASSLLFPRRYPHPHLGTSISYNGIENGSPIGMPIPTPTPTSSFRLDFSPDSADTSTESLGVQPSLIANGGGGWSGDHGGGSRGMDTHGGRQVRSSSRPSQPPLPLSHQSSSRRSSPLMPSTTTTSSSTPPTPSTSIPQPVVSNATASASTYHSSLPRVRTPPKPTSTTTTTTTTSTTATAISINNRNADESQHKVIQDGASQGDGQGDTTRVDADEQDQIRRDRWIQFIRDATSHTDMDAGSMMSTISAGSGSGSGSASGSGSGSVLMTAMGAGAGAGGVPGLSAVGANGARWTYHHHHRPARLYPTHSLSRMAIRQTSDISGSGYEGHGQGQAQGHQRSRAGQLSELQLRYKRHAARSESLLTVMTTEGGNTVGGGHAATMPVPEATIITSNSHSQSQLLPIPPPHVEPQLHQSQIHSQSTPTPTSTQTPTQTPPPKLTQPQLQTSSSTLDTLHILADSKHVKRNRLSHESLIRPPPSFSSSSGISTQQQNQQQQHHHQQQQHQKHHRLPSSASLSSFMSTSTRSLADTLSGALPSVTPLWTSSSPPSTSHAASTTNNPCTNATTGTVRGGGIQSATSGTPSVMPILAPDRERDRERVGDAFFRSIRARMARKLDRAISIPEGDEEATTSAATMARNGVSEATTAPRSASFRLLLSSSDRGQVTAPELGIEEVVDDPFVSVAGAGSQVDLADGNGAPPPPTLCVETELTQNETELTQNPIGASFSFSKKRHGLDTGGSGSAPRFAAPTFSNPILPSLVSSVSDGSSGTGGRTGSGGHPVNPLFFATSYKRHPVHRHNHHLQFQPQQKLKTSGSPHRVRESGERGERRAEYREESVDDSKSLQTSEKSASGSVESARRVYASGMKNGSMSGGGKSGKGSCCDTISSVGHGRTGGSGVARLRRRSRESHLSLKSVQTLVTGEGGEGAGGGSTIPNIVSYSS